MRVSGAIEHAGVGGVMQVIHLGGRTGRLLLERDAERAQLVFVRGQLVAASSRGTSASVVAVVPPAQLESVTIERLESLMVELVGWKHGTFAFLVDAEDSTAAAAIEASEGGWPASLDTQKMILEALRRSASGEPASERWVDPAEGLSTDRSSRRVPAAALAGVELQIVSSDPELVTEVSRALGEELRITHLGIRDAGATPPGIDTVVVLLDLRNGTHPEELELMVRRRPRAVPIAIVGDSSMIVSAFHHGAAVALPYDAAAIVSCVRSAISRYVGHANPDTEQLSVARIRRFLEDIRSGVFSATISLSLMSIVSEYAERAVLFTQRAGSLHAIGAFGLSIPSRVPLAHGVQGLTIPLAKAAGICAALQRGKLNRLECTAENLSQELVDHIGVPSSGHGVFIPVLGRTRVIAAIWADNGALDSDFPSLEVVEVAMSQVGLAFESELLQRQLDSSRSFAGVRRG